MHCTKCTNASHTTLRHHSIESVSTHCWISHLFDSINIAGKWRNELHTWMCISVIFPCHIYCDVICPTVGTCNNNNNKKNTKISLAQKGHSYAIIASTHTHSNIACPGSYLIVLPLPRLCFPLFPVTTCACLSALDIMNNHVKDAIHSKIHNANLKWHSANEYKTKCRRTKNSHFPIICNASYYTYMYIHCSGSARCSKSPSR